MSPIDETTMSGGYARRLAMSKDKEHFKKLRRKNVAKAMLGSTGPSDDPGEQRKGPDNPPPNWWLGPGYPGSPPPDVT